MSSVAVRTLFKGFLETNLNTEKYVDLDGEWTDLNDLLDSESVTPSDNWVGLEYFPSDEVPVTIGATNTSGRYRETGGILISVVAPAALGASGGILTRVEVLRNLLRGQRIGDIVVDSVTPGSFDNGAVKFESGWMSAGFFIGYDYEYNI